MKIDILNDKYIYFGTVYHIKYNNGKYYISEANLFEYNEISLFDIVKKIKEYSNENRDLFEYIKDHYVELMI